MHYFERDQKWDCFFGVSVQMAKGGIDQDITPERPHCVRFVLEDEEVGGALRMCGVRGRRAWLSQPLSIAFRGCFTSRCRVNVGDALFGESLAFHVVMLRT